MKFLRRLGRTLGDLVTSKKVLTAGLTAAIGLVVKDPELRRELVLLGLTRVGAQGIADAGKEASKVNARLEAEAPSVPPKRSRSG
jgi:hypothetical protein